MTTPNNPRRPPSLAAPGTLILTHFAITLLYLIDFLIFQVAAAGATLAIYAAIPALHTGLSPDDPAWSWIRIFQIVSPAITLPGGVATVLSSYIFARRVQEEARLREAAEKERQEEARRREAAEKAQQETEAENRLLKAQLAQATAPRRRRRHLRNNHQASQ